MRRTLHNRNFTSAFGDRTSAFRAKIPTGPVKSQLYFSFLAIEPHFVQKGCGRAREIAIFLFFWAIETHFVRKGCDRTREIATLLQFLVIEPRFVRKGCARTSANENRTFTMFYPSFWRSNLISCKRVAAGRDRTKFRAKGLRPDL